MYAGGQYLESFAEGRARREMSALLERVPRRAVRYREGVLEEAAIDTIKNLLPQNIWNELDARQEAYESGFEE